MVRLICGKSRRFSPEIDHPPGANYTGEAVLNQSRQHTTHALKVILITLNEAAYP